MLFRRIKAHVAKEDWFAVFIDFLIVVFGVFMGFQVQQWNEDRSDQADARGYVERLVADIKISTERNETQTFYGKRQIDQLDIALTALETCQISSDDEPFFAAGLYNMGKYNMPSFVMNTIDELNATGKFHLIGDMKLRRLITDAIREHQTALDLDPQISARTVPSVNFVRTKVRFVLDEHLGVAEKIDLDKAVYDLQELCTDDSFINAIATVREHTLATNSFNQDTLDNQLEILAALREHLGYSETEK